MLHFFRHLIFPCSFLSSLPWTQQEGYVNWSENKKRHAHHQSSFMAWSIWQNRLSSFAPCFLVKFLSRFNNSPHFFFWNMCVHNSWLYELSRLQNLLQKSVWYSLNTHKARHRLLCPPLNRIRAFFKAVLFMQIHSGKKSWEKFLNIFSLISKQW